ncbi:MULTISPECIES: protein kinase domain-containing protein [Anaerolinea]|uniref:protein kinase domain-containing protein n=1 Tax=Anaerolinea TaxID=233189 RepID=UPI002619C421|nr:protein kinase [Anaerolinea thermophila]
MPLAAGTLLNHRYRIVSILGQGGMGAVYRAVDEHLGVHVAVKENLFLTEEYSRQFEREARILAGLRHPGLPHVTDYFVLPGQGQYLVMDYIEGEDLRQRMERSGVLPENEVILIGISVCEALNYLHTRHQPIIHRDLKPGNIKVTPEGQAVLVDFGLAKIMEGNQVTMTGARAMTPGYSPPEQYGTSHTDERSDVYSLGATLYAALTGSIPEDGLNRLTGKEQLTDIRKLRPKINRRLAEVIEKALEVDPDDRFQSAEEFRQALIECSEVGAFFKERPTISPPPPELLAQEMAQNGGSQPSTNGKQKSKRNFMKRRRFQPAILIPVFVLAIGFFYLLFTMRPDLTRSLFAGVYPATPFAGTEIASATPSLEIAQEGTPIPAMEQTPPTREAPSPDPTATENFIPIVPPTPTETPTPVFTPTATPLGGGASEIAFVSERTGQMQIWMMSVDGQNLRQITNMRNGACQPAWSPDGTRLAFISPCPGKREIYEGSAIYLLTLDGSEPVPLPSSPEGDFDPTWSPDGKKLAFTSLRTGRPSIFVIDLQTLIAREISESRYSDLQPAWSPISRQIAFVRRISNSQIWIMSEDGDNQVRFSPPGDVTNFFPIWSWDGQAVLYNQIVGGSKVPRLVGMRYEDRKNPREFRIPASGTVDIGPVGSFTLSPDGFWVVYEGWPDGTNHDIYLMTMNGATNIRLTTDPAFDYSPVWRPVIR